MGDTANWEFAAAVAAVTLGLGGLLVFTLVAIVGGWRVFTRSLEAVEEAAKAAVGMQDLARMLSARQALQAPLELEETQQHLASLRRQSEALIEQQARLQEAVRNLVEAGVLGHEREGEVRRLDDALVRLEDQLARVAAAVAALEGRAR